MCKYRIFDIRNGLMQDDIIVEAKTPKKAVERLYINVERDYHGDGEIVVHGRSGSYVYKGQRKDIGVV